MSEGQSETQQQPESQSEEAMRQRKQQKIWVPKGSGPTVALEHVIKRIENGVRNLTDGGRDQDSENKRDENQAVQPPSGKAGPAKPREHTIKGTGYGGSDADVQGLHKVLDKQEKKAKQMAEKLMQICSDMKRLPGQCEEVVDPQVREAAMTRLGRALSLPQFLTHLYDMLSAPLLALGKSASAMAAVDLCTRIWEQQASVLLTSFRPKTCLADALLSHKTELRLWQKLQGKDKDEASDSIECKLIALVQGIEKKRGSMERIESERREKEQHEAQSALRSPQEVVALRSPQEVVALVTGSNPDAVSPKKEDGSSAPKMTEIVVVEQKQEQTKDDEKKGHNAEEVYCAALGPLQFAEASFESTLCPKDDASKVGGPFLRRLAAEYGALEKSLPLSMNSSVFFRVHEDKAACFQLLIVPALDTPYGGGCFLFDGYLPSAYPQVPPKCQLLTTGHGTVTFNPNLYNNGYICLSLLNQWGASWDPKQSSLLQLAVSLQSLVFVSEPYYNEPGYVGTNAPGPAKQYRVNLYPATIKYAMVEMLQKPPAGFEEVVKTHFKLRGKDIVANCKSWIKDVSTLGTEIEKLEQELAKLADA